MEFAVTPFVQAGPLRFGMTRAEVRSALPGDFHSFRRTPRAEECDHFEALGLFAYYDADGGLEAVEFTRPAMPTLDGARLLDLTVGDASRSLQAITDPEDDACLLASDHGIGFWVPDQDDGPRSRAESVIVHRAGYYDD